MRDRASRTGSLALGVMLAAAISWPGPALGASVGTDAVTYTGLVVSDERYDPTRTHASDPGTVNASASDAGVSGGADGIGWGFFFWHGSEPFHVGTYEDVPGNVLLDHQGVPAMSVVGTTYCDVEQGSFTILQTPVADQDGNVITFAADARYRCLARNGTPLTTGWLYVSFRIGAATPPRVVAAPSEVTFPDTTVGTTTHQVVTLAGLGRGTTTISSVVSEGDDASMYAVTADHCTGAGLSAGVTCTFDLAFSPTSTTKRSTSVRIVGDGPQSSYTFHASGFARSPILQVPSRVLLNADPNMWIGQGTYVDEDPATLTSADSAGPSVVILLSSIGNFNFYPKEGELLSVGHYEVPSWPPYGTAAFDVGAFGHGCRSTGSFDVLEGPTRDLDGALLNVAIDFVMHCDDTPDRLRGSIRFHSSVPVWDVSAPDGQVLVTSGARISNPIVSLDVTATDDTGVGTVSVSNDGRDWATLPYQEALTWSVIDPAHGGTSADGLKRISVRWTDVVGNVSDSVSQTVTLDRAGPIVSTPVPWLRSSTNLSSGSAPVLVRWTGSDPAGIATYAVQQRTDGGSWMNVATSQLASSASRVLRPGHTYAFRVRGTDNVGNVGAWKTGPTFRLLSIDEASSAVRYVGTWSSASGTTYLGGRAKTSVQAGSKATFTFTGRSVALVSRLGPGRGKAEIWMGTTRLATIDLGSTAYSSQRIVWTKTWSTSATRAITIKVLGTSGRPRVEIDGFIVAS